MGLKVLAQKLKEMRVYLEKVVEGEYPYNQQVINNYQDIFNLLPNLKLEQMVQSFSVKSNDYMYVLYVSGLIRSILALHDLINNKISNKETEIARAKREKEVEEEARKKKQEEEQKKEEKEAADAAEKK
jgi:26S proteasome regulatory subunit N8